MHESVYDKHIQTVWQCGLQNNKVEKASLDTFLVSSFSLRTLTQSLAVSNIASVMAQISAFSMSFEPASPVCVRKSI